MSDDLDFDIGLTGFSIPEIDNLMETVAPEDLGDPEDDVVPEQAPACVGPGDIRQLGKHDLICWDSFNGQVVADLMARGMAWMVFTDFL